jgi:hypothetical protein
MTAMGMNIPNVLLNMPRVPGIGQENDGLGHALAVNHVLSNCAHDTLKT